MRTPSLRIIGSTIVLLVLVVLAWFLRPTEDDAPLRGPKPPPVEVRGEQAADMIAPDSSSGSGASRELLADVDAPRPAKENTPVYRLSGRFRNGDGRSIDSANCWLRCENGEGTELTATAEEDARYSVEGLSPGTWLVRAGGRNTRRWSKEIQVLPGEYEMQLDVVLEPAIELRVKVVTSDGRALPPLLTKGEHGLVPALGVEKILQPVALRRPLFSSFLDREDADVLPFEEAQYRLNGYSGVRLPPEYLGLLVLERDLPVYVGLVLHGQVLDTKLVEAADRDVEFVFDPEDLVALTSTLRARFVEAATGEPVTYRYAMFVGWGFSVKLDIDEDGRVEARRWPPGPASLIIGAPGFEQYRDEFIVPPSTTVDLGTIALQPATWISGIATHPDGRPVLGGSVTCRPFSTRDARNSSFATGTEVEEATGEFLIEVDRGHHLLTVKSWDRGSKMSASRTIYIDTTDGSVEGLQVEVFLLTAITLVPDDALPPGLRFQVLDRRGIEVRAGTLTAGNPRIIDLPRGHYDFLVLDEDGGLRKSEGFEVGSEPVSLVVDP